MATQTPWTRTDRQLVDSVGIGRVAFSSGALPVVLVVRCSTAGDRVVLHSDHRDLIHAARAGDVVALQVDDLGVSTADGRDGSSVNLTGVLAIDPAGTVTLTPGVASHTSVRLGPITARAQTDAAGSA